MQLVSLVRSGWLIIPVTIAVACGVERDEGSKVAAEGDVIEFVRPDLEYPIEYLGAVSANPVLKREQDLKEAIKQAQGLLVKPIQDLVGTASSGIPVTLAQISMNQGVEWRIKANGGLVALNSDGAEVVWDDDGSGTTSGPNLRPGTQPTNPTTGSRPVFNPTAADPRGPAGQPSLGDLLSSTDPTRPGGGRPRTNTGVVSNSPIPQPEGIEAGVRYEGKGARYQMGFSFLVERPGTSVKEEWFFPVSIPVNYWKVKIGALAGAKLTGSQLANSIIHLPPALATALSALFNSIGSAQILAQIDNNAEWIAETSRPRDGQASQLAFAIAQDVFRPLCLRLGNSEEECAVKGSPDTIPDIAAEAGKYRDLTLAGCAKRSQGIFAKTYDIYVLAPEPTKAGLDFLRADPASQLQLYSSGRSGGVFKLDASAELVYLGKGGEGCHGLDGAESGKRCARFELQKDWFDSVCRGIDDGSLRNSYSASVLNTKQFIRD